MPGSSRVYAKFAFAHLLMAAGLCLWLPASVDSQPVGSGWTLKAVVQACPTPEALGAFLRVHIRFTDDVMSMKTEDYWQTPEESLERGEGDCEDFALLAEEVLRRRGLKTFLFSLYGEGGYAHTVCVFEENGLYNVLNQDRVVRCQANSLDALATRLNPRWKWGAVAKRIHHRGQAVRIVQNPKT